MWIPGLETLVIKGFVWIGHHLSAATLTKLAAYVVSKGALATAAAILTNPIVIGPSLVIGGVLWTRETANKVNKIFEYLADNKAELVGEMLLEMWLKDKIGDTLDETVGNISGLLSENYDPKTVAGITSELRTIAEEVKKYN